MNFKLCLTADVAQSYNRYFLPTHRYGITMKTRTIVAFIYETCTSCS
uniref:Uncharacterized protein n=1 Tax=Anguilla anguilla TaxID=7936 RepID=A0A0E9QXH4_ANGAN